MCSNSKLSVTLRKRIVEDCRGHLQNGLGCDLQVVWRGPGFWHAFPFGRLGPRLPLKAALDPSFQMGMHSGISECLCGVQEGRNDDSAVS